MKILRYRIRCTTDSKWEELWIPETELEPTTCPVNTAHTIDASLTSVTGSSGGDNPTTDDGRPIQASTRFEVGLDPWFAGSYETSLPGDGPLFQVEWESAPGALDDKYLEGSFRDWVKISKGKVFWVRAKAGDYIGVVVYAPATVVTVADPVDTGNCNLVDIGTGNLIIPANGDGTHDVDLLLATIVPASGAGYWDWDRPDKGRGVITPSATPGAASYHLLDYAKDMVRWAKKVPLLGDGHHMLEPETDTRTILPHWKMRVDVHNENNIDLCVSWVLSTGRKHTVD